MNCAALQENLLESELFGHEKGAFTGADKQRIGRFEQADGGRLFLDEMGDMSPSTQAKILRVLQEHEFERLGGTRTLRVDVRLIAATNRDLPTMVAAGQFREDLYYRLNVVSIDMPPLRERKDDIQALALCFVRRFAGELKKKVDGLDSEALKLLMRYNWPGNIRELENSIERAMLLTEAGQITADDLRLGEVATTQAGRDAQTPVKIPPTGIPLEDIERAALIEALKMSNWVQKDAAELLSISPRVMNYKIKTLRIEFPRGRRLQSADAEADRQLTSSWQLTAGSFLLLMRAPGAHEQRQPAQDPQHGGRPRERARPPEHHARQQKSRHAEEAEGCCLRGSYGAIATHRRPEDRTGERHVSHDTVRAATHLARQRSAATSPADRPARGRGLAQPHRLTITSVELARSRS